MQSRKFTIDIGMPPHEFYPQAWGDEPLTQVLTGTDIEYSLPFGIPERSFIAKDEAGNVIGQCATNDTETYWNHVNHLDTTNKNASTHTFVDIHKLAAQAEYTYLQNLHLDIHDSAHNAGIAVVPDERRKGIGTLLTEQQVAETFNTGKTSLFCETTNHKSAGIMKNLGFFKVADYAYKDLAREVSNDDLTKLDDSFTVWCKTT
jgi:N-acetylglutamate synthase-like GNAT family acetyltransferase